MSYETWIDFIQKTRDNLHNGQEKRRERERERDEAKRPSEEMRDEVRDEAKGVKTRREHTRDER